MSEYQSFKTSKIKYKTYKVDSKDSASFSIKEWNEIANAIVNEYSNYKAFVVVHGL